MYNVKIVADSIGVRHGQRITTYEIEMPKWLVAEFNTHRMLSRNSASSRAIPTKQIIERVMTDPCIPIDFRSKNTGMIAVDDTILSTLEQENARALWLEARDQTIAIVEKMMSIGEGIDKQRVNRLLEPWMKTVVISTATEWENFFTLRNSPEAQPEFGYIAAKMQELYDSNTPQSAKWHWPYVDEGTTIPYEITEQAPEWDILDKVQSAFMHISAARVGRVSYYRQGVETTLEKDLQRGMDFAKNKHWSPLEQTAREATWAWHGNLFTWMPLRKFYANESGMSPKRRHLDGVTTVR